MKHLRSQGLPDYWKKLTSGSINRQIFGAAFIVALLTAFVKLAAFVKEFVVAWRFGTGDELDAFLIALVVPSLLGNVIAASFKSALIPTYIQVREQQGKAAAGKLFSGVMVCSLVVLGITTILMVATAPIYLPIIASGFDTQKLSLTFRLLCAMAPVILLDGIISIWGAILNAGERFALAGLTPIVIPVITIILLLGAKSLGIFALAVGLLSGMLLEAVILGVVLHRQGILLIPKWYGFDANLRQVASQYAPMIAGALLLCSAVPIDQAMAAMLSPGSVAALNYGNRAIAAPMALITTGLTASVMPYCSKMLASEDWSGIRRTLKQYLRLIFLTTVPLAVLLLVFSQPIIKLLFQRGSFTTEDTYLVAQIQAFYALQIPFYIGNLFLIRLISSLKKNQLLMWVSGYDLIINIILNYLFIQFMGIKGIALSTSCVYVFSFLYLLFFANKHIQSQVGTMTTEN